MKTIRLIAIALVCASLLFSANSSAQEKSSFFDNTFASVAGGVNYSIPKIAKSETWGGIGIATEVQLGKWWNPSFGTSVGWHGLTGKAAADLGVPAGDSFGLNYVNACALWNISNTIGGYKERLWNFVPYAHAGLLIQEKDGNFCGFGGGLLNQIRISDRINVNLDFRALIYHRAPHDIYNTVTCCLLMYPSATIGVSINLGKTSFSCKKQSKKLPASASVPAAGEAATTAEGGATAKP